MKRSFIILITILVSISGCQTAKQILDNATITKNNTDVSLGLKEALRLGTDTATKHLSLLNGFYGDDMIRILMPPEAQKVEKTLRNEGFGGTVDKAILSMNRAAEDASKQAGDILWKAITLMTFDDAIGILKGVNYAATEYLKRTSSMQLTTVFRPVIQNSLTNVNATKHWNDVFSVYNKLSNNPVNTDLAAYVTEKALAGLFYHIGLQEQKIRKDPAARVTEILKRVFGN